MNCEGRWRRGVGVPNGGRYSNSTAMDRMFVSSQNSSVETYSPLRWCLEVGSLSGVLRNGISKLIKETAESSLTPFTR